VNTPGSATGYGQRWYGII